jgi:hypothetical protein
VSPLLISFDDLLVRFSLSSQVFPFVCLQSTKGRPTLIMRLDYYFYEKKVIYGNLSIEGPNLHTLSCMRESVIASIES